MMAVNSVRFLRHWGGAREWARFLVYDVLSLPAMLVLAPFRGRTKAVLGSCSIGNGCVGPAHAMVPV